MSEIIIEKLELATFKDLPPVYQAPQFLYAKGRKEAMDLFKDLSERGLAVVGTRRPQPRTEAYARKVILELRGSRLIIVSGLAHGIDTIAHQSALDAELPTSAILGSGVNRIYPRANIPLAEKITQAGGLLLSEYPPEEEARPGYFLRRNRLIAALTRATWIVEASYRSGALNTAKWARDHDRHCFATPAFPGDVALAGNLSLFDRVEADPLWNARSLGKVWIDLATLSDRADRVQPDRMRAPSQQDQMLALAVRNLTAQQGCAQVHQLLDWAIARDWSPERFFSTLQRGLEHGLIREQSGILIPGA
jgi:DNA protecting protein DprA